MTVEEGEILGVKDIETVEQTNYTVYTISGVRVNNPAQHGIYIVNGKKVVK